MPPAAYLANSTIAQNTAMTGGGVYSAAAARTTMVGVTDGFNRALRPAGAGGGGAAGAASSTTTPGLAEGGGLYAEAGAEVELVNTIIAMNTADDGAPDVSGVVSSLGYNLIGVGDGSSGWVPSGSAADMVGTLYAPVDPLLNPLGDYGGPTLTMTLQADSPARRRGNPLAVEDPTDQRGFPRVVDGFVDIGAVQMQPGE